jgi:hypothetical protein
VGAGKEDEGAVLEGTGPVSLIGGGTTVEGMAEEVRGELPGGGTLVRMGGASSAGLEPGGADGGASIEGGREEVGSSHFGRLLDLIIKSSWVLLGSSKGPGGEEEAGI